MKKMTVLVLISIVFIYFRIVLNDSAHEVRLVGAINILALVYVVIDILGRAYSARMRKLKATSFPQKTIKQKQIAWIVGMSFVVIASVIVGTFYFTRYASSKANDILAIIALYLSLVCNEFEEWFKSLM